MEFLRQISCEQTSDKGRFRVFVGSTDVNPPRMSAEDIGSFAMLTDLTTGKLTLTQYTGDSAAHSVVSGWEGWQDNK